MQATPLFQLCMKVETNARAPCAIAFTFIVPSVAHPQAKGMRPYMEDRHTLVASLLPVASGGAPIQVGRLPCAIMGWLWVAAAMRHCYRSMCEWAAAAACAP